MVSNTLCPKMGITQWTCTYKECTCHLKEKIEEDLRGGCHLIWLANGGQTEEWNGDGCRCKYVAGDLDCELIKQI